MMLRRQILQPQRILHHRVRSQPRCISMCAQKRVDRLKRNFQPSQPKRRMRPRIQPDVNQLIIIQLDLALRSRLIRHLQIALPCGDPSQSRFIRIDDPSTGHNSSGLFRIARSLHLDRPIPAHDDVFQHLLGKRPERIVRIRRMEVLRQNLRPLRAIGNRFQRNSLPRLNPPAHPRNAILNVVDRPPRNRNLRKPPQVVSRRLRHDVARRPIRVENGRQRQGPPLLLRVPQREPAEDTPAIRRKAPRNVSVIFMMFSLCWRGRLARENPNRPEAVAHSCPFVFCRDWVELCFPSNPQVILPLVHQGLREIDPPNRV